MRLSRRDLLIALLVVTGAAAAALWWFQVAPARERAESRSAQLTVVSREVNALQDTVVRMRDRQPDAAARTAERLRLAKALPADDQVPEALLQLEDLAQRAGVELTSISAGASEVHGTLRGARFELVVVGRFHDVDDFLYRLHNQVTLDERRRPAVNGRLIALTTVSISPEGSDAEGERVRLGSGTRVRATVGVVGYVAPPDDGVDAGAMAPPPAPATVPGAAEAPVSGPSPDEAPVAGDAPPGEVAGASAGGQESG